MLTINLARYDTQNFNDDLASAKRTLEWAENFIKMTEMAENVPCQLRIQWTSTVFAKKWYETTQEHLLFKLRPLSLETNREVLAFFDLSKLSKISPIQKPDPRAKKIERKPDLPRAVRTCESAGVARGDGHAWNWLIHNSRMAWPITVIIHHHFERSFISSQLVFALQFSFKAVLWKIYYFLE